MKKELDTVWNHKEIAYLKDFKQALNFTFMSSLALCAAYIAGLNRESVDCNMFTKVTKKI